MAPQEMPGRSERVQHPSQPRSHAPRRNARHSRRDAQPQGNLANGIVSQQHQANGYSINGSKPDLAEPQTSKSGKSNAPSAFSEDLATLELRVQSLSTERARIQEQEEFYKGVIAQRSEAHKLRAELAAAQEQADAFKDFHSSTKAHLEHQYEDLERQYNQVKDRLAAHISRIQELEDRVGSQETIISEKEKTCQEHCAALESLHQSLRDSQQSHEHAQAEIGGLREKLQAAESVCNNLQNEKFGLQARIAQLQENLRTEGELRRQSYDQGLAAKMQEYEERMHALAMEASQYRESNFHLHQQLEALRAPRAPMMDETTLLDRIDGIIPIGAAAAMHLEQGLVDRIAQLVWPNDWGIHYAKFGSIRDFLVAHAERYPQRMDGAFYRPEPRLRFGSTPLDFPSPAKRVMTLEERTVGPPGPTGARPADSQPKAMQEPKPVIMYPQIPAPPALLLVSRQQQPTAAPAAQRAPPPQQRQPQKPPAQAPTLTSEKSSSAGAPNALIAPDPAHVSFNPQVMAKLTGKPTPTSQAPSATPQQQFSQGTAAKSAVPHPSAANLPAPQRAAKTSTPQVAAASRGTAASRGAAAPQDPSTARREGQKHHQQASASRQQDRSGGAGKSSAASEPQRAHAESHAQPLDKPAEQATQRGGNVMEVQRRAMPNERSNAAPKASVREGPPPGMQSLAKPEGVQANGHASQRGKSGQHTTHRAADTADRMANSRSSSAGDTPSSTTQGTGGNGNPGSAGKSNAPAANAWKQPNKAKETGPRNANAKEGKSGPPGLTGSGARSDSGKPQRQYSSQPVWQERQGSLGAKQGDSISSKPDGKQDESSTSEWSEVPSKSGPRTRNADMQGKQPVDSEPSGTSGEERLSSRISEAANKEATAGKSKRRRGGGKKAAVKEAGS